MIVSPAIFEENRTVWSLEAEAGDSVPPRPTLWIDGFVRPTASALETLSLALVVAPFARQRIVVPTAATEALCEGLQRLLGVSVVTAATMRQDREVQRREFSAVLVRDPLDLFLSNLALVSPNWIIESGANSADVGLATNALHIASNAGVLRRACIPLDRLGDLAALLMVAPSLGLESVASFFCREELGGFPVEELSSLAEEAGIGLRVPFAAASILDLGRHAISLGIPPIVTFRSLWDRYRMHPAVMGELYRELSPFLPSSVVDNASIRVAEYFARLLPATGAAPQAIVGGSFGLEFFAAFLPNDR